MSFKEQNKIYVFARDLMRESQTRAREKRTGAKMKRTRGAKREESRSRSRMTRTLSSACGAMRTAKPGEIPDQISL